MRAGWCCTTAGCTFTIESRTVTQMTEVESTDDMTATPRMPGGPLPRFEHAAGAAQLDLRPRADRGRRHHDVPGLAHHRRGDAGRQRGERMAVGRVARGDHSDHPGARPRSRRRRGQGGRGRARLSRHRRGAGLFEGGILQAARAVARQRAHARRIAGAAPDRGQDRVRRGARPSATATDAGRAGAGRHARRSSRLDRPHARHGRHRGRRRRRAF